MNKKKTRESGKTKDQGAKNQLKSETPGVTEAELRELLQRTQANFENYRKQTEKRIADIRQSASQGIILELLPILDNLSCFEKCTKTHKA
jgi:molecular chaperone GrpE (heat shock protein)